MVLYHESGVLSSAERNFAKKEMTLDHDLSPRSQGSLLFILGI